MNKEQILQLVFAAIREVLPDLDEHPFVASDRLADLGANSVHRAEIVIAVLERMSLKIPLRETFGPTNVGELADLLYAKSIAR